MILFLPIWQNIKETEASNIATAVFTRTTLISKFAAYT